ncbi:MAG: carboxypeptidase-like regulatory domain-containing protein [Xanthobacteraceae bacterium]|nr:carboxypeptidase-like regulatory domain-containing protein [Xanthobacteraceae bacterium]
MDAGAQEQQRHTARLAVWDVPVAVPAGETFSVKAGVKSAGGVPLGGGRVEVHDGAGTVVASGALGHAPWLGSEALYWTEIALQAPAEPAALTLTARFDGNASEPHESTSSAFSIHVVARAEHTLTVTVEASGAPLADALVRLGPYRAPTDAAGVARVRLAKGQYELVVWKTGYVMTATPIAVEADAAIAVATQPVSEENPDAVWTA